MTTTYSNFTINANRAAAGNPNQPTLRGDATIIDVDGTSIQFEHGIWGPNTPTEPGKREYYSLRMTPRDPALAARQAQMANGRIPTPEIPNAIAGFEAGRIGQGVLFERTREELTAATTAGKRPTSFFGNVVVLLPSGPRAIDLAAWFRPEHNFHSGSANHHDPAKAQAAREAKAAPSAARPAAPRGRRGAGPAEPQAT